MDSEGVAVPLTALPTAYTFVDPYVIVASSASAVSARLFTHPLDTLRIKVQTYPGAIVPPWRDLFPKPRMRSLYAGLPVAVAFSMPALSIYLTSYEGSKRWLAHHLLPKDRKPTLLQQMPIFILAGGVAEIASGAFWTPLEVLKSRLQKGGEGTTSGTKLLGKIWREEGYRGVWRGYWVSMAIFIPSISLYWLIYETLKGKYIPNYDAYKPAPPSDPNMGGIPLTARYTLCSVVACTIAASVTNPIELVQSRWQTSAGRGGGIRTIIRDLWKQGGPKAFMRGMGIRVMYAIPANGISMTVYESLKRYKGI
ncbi:hypothetical protein RQP46_002818 [Phenoliferia psychrophenolica]